jgi:hypothetical protein
MSHVLPYKLCIYLARLRESQCSNLESDPSQKYPTRCRAPIVSIEGSFGRDVAEFDASIAQSGGTIAETERSNQKRANY